MFISDGFAHSPPTKVGVLCLRPHIEVDESYFGASRPRGAPKQLKRGQGTLKQPVFGIFERDGQVYTAIVPDCKKATLQAIILGEVSLETVIYSDGWPGYDGLVSVGYDKHLCVNHQTEYRLGNGQHINGIESFSSFTKRRLRRFNGIAKHVFYLHLKESEWGWKNKPTKMQDELSKRFNIRRVSNRSNNSDDDDF